MRSLPQSSFYPIFSNPFRSHLPPLRAYSEFALQWGATAALPFLSLSSASIYKVGWHGFTVIKTHEAKLKRQPSISTGI